MFCRRYGTSSWNQTIGSQPLPTIMSDDDENVSRSASPEIESIIATRARRSNAGSRMKALIESEEPMEEDAEGIFMEFAEDEDFEDNGEQSEDGDSDEDENEDGNGSENGEEGEGNDGRDNSLSRSGKRSRQEHQEGDDENFSDSDSSEEEEEEEDDAGEKELQKQKREEQKRKSKSLRKNRTAPLIKKPRAEDPASEERRRKARELAQQRQADASKQLMDASRRSSKRASTIKNKQQVLERIQEAETRRAQYIAPVAKEVHRMTQEELLEEAKITEQKNLASLRFYVEQEELRKQRQRAAMLAKRVPMTKFIRYSSKTTLIPPRRLFVRQPIELVMARFATTPETNSETKDQVKEEPSEPTVESDAKGDADEEQSQSEATPAAESTASNDGKENQEITEAHSITAAIADDSEISADVATSLESSELKESDTLNNSSQGTKDEPENAENIKAENKTSQDTVENAEEKVSSEPAKEYISTTTVYGPYACRERTTVSALGFTDGYELPSNRLKQILLGYQSMETEEPNDRKLQCVITGQPAKYIDPATKIPYSSMQALKIINMVKSGSMAWNTTFGGLFTGLLDRNQRHAGGVPTQFYK